MGTCEMHDDKPDEDSHELQRPQKSKEILEDQIHIQWSPSNKDTPSAKQFCPY